jgi:hypothetical protein
MATSRRTRSAGGRPAGKPAASEALERNVPAIDPNEAEAAPADEVAAEPAPSSASSRRVARQSRRIQAESSAKTPAYRSARVLTPEEQLKRKQAIKNGFKLAVMLILFLAAVGAGWFFLIKENPREGKAKEALAQGRAALKVIEGALNNRQPAEARKQFADGLKALAVPELGNAKEPLLPDDPNIVNLKMAQAAVEVAKQIRETEARIDKIERDIKAERNQRKVMAGFKDLMQLDEAAFVEHEKFTGMFLKNPVEPPTDTQRDDYLAEYQSLIQDVKAQLIRIDQEKDRRQAAITTDQEKQAHGEVQAMVKQERFKDAVDKLDAYKGKFEKGNFDGLRTFVDASAKQAWESAKSFAESRYADYKAPGIPPPIAAQALKEARTRLEQVIERFGIDAYVTQAKELLAKYPTP